MTGFSYMEFRQMRFVCACFVLLLSMFVLPGKSFSFVMDEFPPLPRVGTMSDEEFLQTSEVLEVKPKGESHLAFKLSVPRSWGVNDDEGGSNEYVFSRNIIGELVRIYSPPLMEYRSRITVEAVDLEHKVTAMNWFIYYAYVNGYAIQGVEEVVPGRIVAQYVIVEGDVAYTVRAVAEYSAKKMVIVKYYVPNRFEGKFKPLQERVIDSFVLQDPDKEFYEPVGTFSFLGIVKFDYPIDWELRTISVRDILRLHAYVVDISNGSFHGRMDVYAINKEETDFEEEFEKIQGKLSDSNLEIGDFVEEITGYEFEKSIINSNINVYKTKNPDGRDAKYEYWQAVLEGDRDYSYVATMITLSREDGFYSWARNIEVFRDFAISIKQEDGF